jgi:hypothetical protein
LALLLYKKAVAKLQQPKNF